MAEYQRETHAVKSGIASDKQFGSVVPPIYLSTNYTFEAYGQKREFDYSRSGNPTRNTLGQALAELEQGAGAVITGSGMGAINLVALALLKADDLLVAPHDCYGGTYRLFQYMAARGSYRVRFVDQGDAEALAATPTVSALLESSVSVAATDMTDEEVSCGVTVMVPPILSPLSFRNC